LDASGLTNAGHFLRHSLRDASRGAKLLYAGLKREVRSNEIAQLGVCAVIGATVGVSVTIIHNLVLLLHRLDFRIPGNALLSTGVGIDQARILIVPALGGLFLGVLALMARRFGAGDIVDPVEANALYGGRMSMLDSMRLTLSTVISNAAGASLGMEAGYTQFGSGLFAAVGSYFNLRRADRRVFVTAGAAAAIAAAFNAPLAGAFYGYELILGSYTPAALAPIAVASICGTLSERLFGENEPWFYVSGSTAIHLGSYALFGLMGVLAAGLGVLAMTAVTSTERTLRAWQVPDWLRPCAGGLVLSAIAFFDPQVLGSGHGGIQYHFSVDWSLLPLFVLLVAKLLASAISVGSGFRGGLFSSSLFLGCLFGGVFAKSVAYFDPAVSLEYQAFLLVGMGAVAAAVVGAPFTMVFLVLESTQDFPMTIGVLVSVIASSTIVRLTFGYSFSTWRFHVRGLTLRGAYDVGWLAELSVARFMRSDPKLAQTGMPLRSLRAKYPPGSAKQVFAVAPDGHYAGWVDMATVHDPQLDDVIDAGVVADIVQQPEIYLLPSESIRAALSRFEEGQCEALPVLSARSDPRVIGYVTEAYALRRYTQELERRSSAELGQRDLFSLGQTPRG
jgi:chloride channel protein, CIC family